ncbi:MAG TPA: PD-(D/E)XK nuclease family protein, partial [Nitrospira sp.]|nr:PD-(D/E)XK nuclease family protein [Nitrospira sp.]
AARVDEDYFLKLDKDEQITTYLWATINEQDMPWSGQMVDRALYTALRKRYPTPPTPTYQGKALSVDRTKEATTAEMFEAAVKADPVLGEWFRNTKKAQDYYTYLCAEGDEVFVMREMTTRNDAEIKAHGRHMRMIAEEMLDPNVRIYPNPTGNFLCLHCAFRSPCLAADDGSDWIGLLNDGYEQNRDR